MGWLVLCFERVFVSSTFGVDQVLLCLSFAPKAKHVSTFGLDQVLNWWFGWRSFGIFAKKQKCFDIWFGSGASLRGSTLPVLVYKETHTRKVEEEGSRWIGRISVLQWAPCGCILRASQTFCFCGS